MPAYRDAYNEYSQNPATAQLTVGWQSYPNLRPYYKIVPGGVGTTINPDGVRGGATFDPYGPRIEATVPQIDRRDPPAPRPPQIVQVPYYVQSGPSWLTVMVFAFAGYYLGKNSKVK